MEDPIYIQYVEPLDLKSINWEFDIPSLRPIAKPKKCNCIEKVRISKSIKNFILKIFCCHSSYLD